MFSEQFIERMEQAQSLAVLTGAGISAESGVPTFRGEHGLWKTFRSEDIANMDAFRRNPQLLWEWYQSCTEFMQHVAPNTGHYALVTIERAYQKFALITQNIDNLHQRAGSENICELHGNIMRNRCVDCNRKFNKMTTEIPTNHNIPHCECGGLIRPDVVWFGESLPVSVIDNALMAAQSCEVFLIVGTSAVVHPAARLPIEAGNAGAYVIEINVEPTVISNYVNESIFGKSGMVLPALVERLGL